MHKKMFTRIILALFLVGTIFALSFAYKKLLPKPETKSEKKTLNILTYKNIPLSTLDGFHTLYPDYKINIERYSEFNYLSFLDTKLNQESSIDIIELPAEAYPDYIQQGSLLPLNSMTLFTRINGNALGYLRKLSKTDTYYGIPYQSNYIGIWYNVSLFEKYELHPPDNLEHFLTACKVFSENDIAPLATGLADDYAANNLLTLLTADSVASAPVPVTIDNEFAGIDNPDYLPALQECYHLLPNGYLPENCLTMTDEQAFEAFLNSYYAMAVSPENSISMVNDSVLQQIDLNVCGFHLSSTGSVVGVPVDSVLCINAHTSNIEISKLFLDYYTQYNTVFQYINNTGTMTTIQNPTLNQTLSNSWDKIKQEGYFVPANHLYLSPFLCSKETYSIPRKLFYNLITPQEFTASLRQASRQE